MRRALLLSVALLLPACGPPEQEVDPQVAYVEQATEICQRTEDSLEELEVPSTPEGFAPYTREVVDILETAQSDLSELTPPEDDRAELEERVLDPFEQVVAEAQTYADRVEAAGTNQVALLALLPERPTADAVDTEFLREYGLPTCADAIEQAG